MQPRTEKLETDLAPARSTAVASSALCLLCGVLCVAFFQLCAFGQGTIVYSGFVGRPLGDSGVDFDGDGTVEFSFSAIYQSIGFNPEFHTNTYFVTPAAHAALALDGGSVGLVSSGTPIGDSLSPVWSSSSDAFALLTVSYVVPLPWPDPGYPTGSPYGGPLADAGGLAYLAARWQSSAGWHYGWIRLIGWGVADPDDPFVLYLGQLVADWAYNSMPGEPILAGAVPEPSAWALLFSGGFVFFVYGRRKRMA